MPENNWPAFCVSSVRSPAGRRCRLFDGRRRSAEDARRPRPASLIGSVGHRRGGGAGMTDIPGSPHNPKFLWVDDAEIVGDRITEVRPVPGNFFTQKTERRISELGACCVAFVVRDV